MAEGIYYAALWEAGDDSNYYSIGLSLPELNDLATERHKKGLRLVDIDTYVENGQRRWAGVWRTGNWANYYSVDLSLTEFNDLATERHEQGLRLVDITTYVEGGWRRWAGIWQTGDWKNYYSVDLSLQELDDLASERHKTDLRLIHIETYVENGQRRWAGLWQAGNWANYYSVDLSLQQLNELAVERHKEGLRLIDLWTYQENGQRRWGGLWRTGNWANYYTVKLDAEKLKGLARERHAKQLRILSIEAYEAGCDAKYLNQVVLPAKYTDDEGALHTGETYVYGVTGHPVAYRWPVDEQGGQRFARVAALSLPKPFLVLPFSDHAVKRFGIWRYGNGIWHHAGDYGKGADTFKVLAAAAGKVIFVGWDDWSGNTVIVSHDVEGVEDSCRTLYMHLRNGPQPDCQKSWTRSVPYVAAMSDANLLAAYKQHLNQTGCKEDPGQRNPDSAYWGTGSHAIAVSVNANVEAGALIGYAGMTGPGGQRNPGPPNTHLHIFWTVRDPENGQWYFFDPYGLYAKPDCYPAGMTNASPDNCVRYPIAWKGGKPSYPV